MMIRVEGPIGKHGNWHDANRVVQFLRGGQALRLPMKEVRPGDVGVTTKCDEDGIHSMRKVLRLEQEG